MKPVFTIIFTVCLLTISPGLQASEREPSKTNNEPPENLETVVVEGQAIPAELKKQQTLTPGGVTILDASDFYHRKVSNLADMLRYVPGIFAAQKNGADEVYFSSRGSNLDAIGYDGNGIKFLLNGLPITIADGSNHNRAVNPLSARAVVVARGANALTYGASTLGGAINFITPTGRDVPPLSVYFMGGNHGLLTGRMTAGMADEDFDGLVTLDIKRWDGYREHTSQEKAAIYANAGWRLADDWTLRVFANYLQSDQELPGALTRAEVEAAPYQASSDAVHGNFQKNVTAKRLAAKTTWEIDADSSLELGLSYGTQALYHPIVDQILVDFDGPGPMAPVEVFSLLIDTELSNTGAMARYNVQLDDHDLLIGFNYADESNTGGNYRNLNGQKNGLTEYVDNSADTLEAFIVDRWQFEPRWTLIYGTQFVSASRSIHTTDAATGAERHAQDDYSAVNPRAGLVYEYNAHTELFGSISRVYEAPTLYQLRDEASASNATLEAMNGTVLEFGARSHKSEADGMRWRWEVAAYYTRLNDEILSVENPAQPGTALSTNIDSTIHAGVEALLGMSIPLTEGGEHRLDPLISFTLNEFSFDGHPQYGDNTLPIAPSYVLRGELLYRHSSGFYIGPTFDFIGERYADFANTYKLDSYSLMGLRAGFTAANWEVFGEIDNLADDVYIATTTARANAAPNARVLYPGAPRSVFVGFRYQF